MGYFDHINSPLQKIDTINGVELWIKREDLIHPEVSGNKWRKLKFYIEDFRRSKKEVILTFGGAFSNHIAATAAFGKMAGIPTKALVRGEEVSTNDTLDFCRACGMEIETISRREYATKDDREFLRLLQEKLPEVYVIPEGGKGVLGVKGCTEILDETYSDFDYIACPAGTGTTVSGLLLSGVKASYLTFSALKGGGFLEPAIKRNLLDYQLHFSTTVDEEVLLREHLTTVENYHFGGYGKITTELVEFMNSFFRKYSVPLDPVYTGKMMFGILDMIHAGKIQPGSKVMAIHTGGLQGIKGMNQRLLKSGNSTIKYET